VSAVRWHGYLVDLPGATPDALESALDRALSDGVRVAMHPDGSAVAWRPGSANRYAMTPDGRCTCMGATTNHLCKHRAAWALERALTHEPP
jgi:hypothetical protein